VPLPVPSADSAVAGTGTGAEAPVSIARRAAPELPQRGAHARGGGSGGEEQDGEISTPTAFKRHVHVAKNPETGELEGLEEWMRAVALESGGETGRAGSDSDVTARRGQQGVERLSLVLPSNLGGRIRSWWHGVVEQGGPRDESEEEGGGMDISAPFNFQHVNHVVVDAESETGFRGLPEEWQEMLKTAGTTSSFVCVRLHVPLSLCVCVCLRARIYV